MGQPLARYRTGLRFAVALPCLFVLTSCWGIDPPRKPPQSVDHSTKTRSIFSLPRLALPGFGGGSGGAMPASEKQCRASLKRLGVTYEDIAPIRENANCGIAHPVKVSSLARGVKLTPAAVLNCGMAEETARWLQGDMAYAARARYLSGIAEVRQMSAYSCRRIRGSGNWSEHSTGNAIDIGAIKLDNGRVIDVARPHFFALREKNFLHRVRSKACDHFTTVLGPGSDSDHADHFHFDLRARKSGYRHCD